MYGVSPSAGYEPRPNDDETDHEFCDTYFEQTTRRNEKGQYIVRIPFKSNAEIGESFNAARSKLRSMLRRFKSNPETKKFYVSEIRDMILRRVLQPGKREDIKYFVSQHTVVKEDSLEDL